MVSVSARSFQKKENIGRGRNVLAPFILSGLGVYLVTCVSSSSYYGEFSAPLNNNTFVRGIIEYAQCPVRSIDDLSADEVMPKAGPRHMVQPPVGGMVTLICCETTKGSISALLHHVWSPKGVERLVQMIRSKYFSTKIPLFRCTDACQFGISSAPQATKQYAKRLQDDPMWLPPGKDNRKNNDGVVRYPEGMWTYAGAGPNSRSNQFVLTLKSNPFMGGGSPWEVPLGELVGKQSFDVLPKLYNGYGEKGPGQGLLRREGVTEKIEKEWPLMDYILSCDVIEEKYT